MCSFDALRQPDGIWRNIGLMLSMELPSGHAHSHVVSKVVIIEDP